MEGRAETESEKGDVLARLWDVWNQNPQYRLGQLIYVACNWGMAKTTDMFNVEDHDLIKLLEEKFGKGKEAA